MINRSGARIAQDFKCNVCGKKVRNSAVHPCYVKRKPSTATPAPVKRLYAPHEVEDEAQRRRRHDFRKAVNARMKSKSSDTNND